MPQPADCVAPDSLPLRGDLLTTWGDDCPTQAEKIPNRPATITKTERGQPRAGLKQHAGTRAQNWSSPRVGIKFEKKSNTGSPDLKEASGIDNQGP